MSTEKSLERALNIAGNRNKYQYVLLTTLCVLFYLEVFPIMGPSFYYMDPIFVCKGSEDIVDEKDACPKLDECKITNNFTIVSELGLYCDRQDERNLIQSTLSVGSMLGLLFMNSISDLRGRKFALIIDIIMGIFGIIFTIIGTYASSTTLLTIAALLSGFSGYSCFIVSYIIASDFCEEQLRQKGTLMMNFAYSLGLVAFFFLYNWCNQWQNILFLFMLIPFIGIFIICFFLVLESPNYYLFKLKNKQKCLQSLVSVAHYNQRSGEQIQSIKQIINSIRTQDLQDKSPNNQLVNASANTQQAVTITQQEQKPHSFWVTLRQWKYLKIIIFMALTQAGGNLFYFGIQFAIDDIGFNYGVDNLVLGLAEIVITIALTKYVTKLMRKKTIVISYLLTAVVALLFLISPIRNSAIICTFLIILIRFFTTTAYFMIVMIQTESFPLEIQSVGAGAIEAFSQLGSIGAPLIVAFCIDLGLNKMATMGGVMLVLMISLKFVPQPPKQPNEQLDESKLKESLIQQQVA